MPSLRFQGILNDLNNNLPLLHIQGVNNNRLKICKFVGISHEFLRQKGIPAHPCSMHIQGIDNDLKNTIKAGGSTTRAQNVDCMDGWMGDTPWTVTTTRAPTVLKILYTLYNILYIYNLKKQFKVQIIGILEEIDSFY